MIKLFNCCSCCVIQVFARTCCINNSVDTTIFYVQRQLLELITSLLLAVDSVGKLGNTKSVVVV